MIFVEDFVSIRYVFNRLFKCLFKTLFQVTLLISTAKVLETYMKLGLEVEKIHRIIEFTEEDFMKPYIDFCMGAPETRAAKLRLS